jgi:hypothetical protein
MNPVPIGDWADFFVAEVGASAALTGLRSSLYWIAAGWFFR